MKIKAKAKINLSLNILGVKDGFHMLESVVAQIDLADIIYVQKSDKVNVEYSNFKISPEKDNTVKAIKEFCKEFNTPPIKAYVKKNIPAKAGLGGSSADAVGVVKAMEKLYNITDSKRVLNLLAKIGSDCPVQYLGGYALMKGRGEIVEKINASKKLYYLLICEDDGVDTKQCFELSDRVENNALSDNDKLVAFLQGKAKVSQLDNALKKPAEMLNENVSKNLQILANYFSLYNLTGSGSCCYGVTQSYFYAKKIYKKLKKQGIKVILAKSTGK